MLGGITLIGIVTATMAFWIVQRVAAEDTEHQPATAAEIENFRTGLDMLRNEIRQMTDALAAERDAPRAATVACVEATLTGISAASIDSLSCRIGARGMASGGRTVRAREAARRYRWWG